MKAKILLILYSQLLICLFFSGKIMAETNKAPQLRIKTGVSTTTVTAGNVVNREKLQSLVTFQPTVVWDFPSFSSRIGIHYLQELASPFSLTPLSGTGISIFYYLSGLSSGYEFISDDIVFQKSKPSFFIFNSISIVNLNMNYFNTSSTINNYFFSASMTDIGIGVGYDYPIFNNILIAGEVVFRNGVIFKGTDQNVSYNGVSVYLTVATAYY